jgi:hypothetical protein
LNSRPGTCLASTLSLKHIPSLKKKKEERKEGRKERRKGVKKEGSWGGEEIQKWRKDLFRLMVSQD